MEWMQILSLIFLLLASLYFSWREYLRKNRKRILWRVAATWLIFVSMYLLMFPLTWKGAPSYSTDKTGIILTVGYEEDSVKARQAKNSAVIVIDASDISAAPADIREFAIFGYGFPVGSRFSTMPPNMMFRPAAVKEGVTAVYWNENPSPGDVVQVKGRYYNPQPRPAVLKLSAFSVTEDSVIIDAGRTEDFVLTTTPRFEGRAVYKLSAIAGTDTIETNAVPLKVGNVKRPVVMMLSSSPGFEQRFFQDWLSAESYSVISRVRTSRDRIERKFVNIPKQLQQQSLSMQIRAADVLICDANEFDRLSASEKQTVFDNVSENGLGLLIRTDSLLPQHQLFRKSFSLSGLNRFSNGIQLRSSENKHPVTVPFDGQQRYIRQTEFNSAVITDSTEKIVVGKIRYGNGAVALSLMPSLYPLTLSGKQDAFSELWATVVDAVSVKSNEKDKITSETRFPVADEELNFLLMSVDDQEKKLFVGDIRIALEQDADLAGFYRGKYWPRSSGWIDGIKSTSDTTSIYIYSSGDWKNIRMRERVEYTKQLIKNNANKKENVFSQSTGSKKIPHVFLYLMLILSTVFLWIEKKFA